MRHSLAYKISKYTVDHTPKVICNCKEPKGIPNLITGRYVVVCQMCGLVINNINKKLNG